MGAHVGAVLGNAVFAAGCGSEPYRRGRSWVDVVVFADLGRSLVVDAGWRDVAGSCMTWLDVHHCASAQTDSGSPRFGPR